MTPDKDDKLGGLSSISESQSLSTPIIVKNERDSIEDSRVVEYNKAIQELKTFITEAQERPLRPEVLEKLRPKNKDQKKKLVSLKNKATMTFRSRLPIWKQKKIVWSSKRFNDEIVLPLRNSQEREQKVQTQEQP